MFMFVLDSTLKFENVNFPCGPSSGTNKNLHTHRLRSSVNDIAIARDMNMVLMIIITILSHTVELHYLPLEAESHDCEYGGVDHDLHEHALGVARKVAECPGVLHPGLVQLHGHAYRGVGYGLIAFIKF